MSEPGGDSGAHYTMNSEEIKSKSSSRFNDEIKTPILIEDKSKKKVVF